MREEADTRMLLHAVNSTKQGCRRILVRTVDTDVVLRRCQYRQKTDRWTVHCVIWNGKTFRHLDTTHIAQKLGKYNDKCHLLPAFHALTGCDTTSGFAGRGKRTAWSVWSKFKDVTPLYLHLPKHQQQHAHTDEILPTIKKFIILMLWLRNSWWRCKQGHANFVHTESKGNREHSANKRCPTSTPQDFEQHIRLVMCGARL